MRSIVAFLALGLALAVGSCGWSPPQIPQHAELDPELRLEIEKARARGDALPLGMLFDANGFHAEAARCYEQHIEDPPQREVKPFVCEFRLEPIAECWDHLGRMRESLGDTEGAIEAYSASIREDSEYGPTHRRLGRLLLDTGDEIRATRHLERAVGLGDPNANSILRGLRGLPVTLVPESQRLAGDPRLKRVRSYQGGPRMRLAHARDVLQEEGPEEALPLLQDLAEQRPEDMGVLGTLAASAVRLDRFDLALAHIDAAEVSSPGNSRVSLVRGETLAARGDLAGAEAAFDEAIRRQPDLAVAHARLGLLRADRGDAEGALASLAEAQRLGLRDPGSLLRLGVLQRMTGRDDAAVATFTQVTAEAPESFSAWIFLARARGEAGDLPGAWKAHERARELGPDRPEIVQVSQRLQELETPTEGPGR